MKKLFFILVLVAFTLISCDKNEVTELQQQTDLNRLEFKSKDEVIAAIEALDNGDDCDVLLKNPNFVNYMKANEMISVITSYSIHYTKLYEDLRPDTPIRSRRPRRGNGRSAPHSLRD